MADDFASFLAPEKAWMGLPNEGNVISVFFAGNQQRWVIRRFEHGLCMGDRWWHKDTEPSIDELRAEYPGYQITGYTVSVVM